MRSSTTRHRADCAPSSNGATPTASFAGRQSPSVSPADVPVPSGDAGQEAILVDHRTDYSVFCRWTITNFSKLKARTLWSRYFEVGGFDCRLLVYPRGDTQALPGYFSVYLQITDPRGSSSSKWDCFVSYRLAIVNHLDDSKSIHRDSWHRFSSKKKSHGWCDFTPSSVILDPKSGFLASDSILITVDILILHESITFSRDSELPSPDVLSGKFTWKVHNFALFKDMIKTQKIMSPVFSAGDCNLRISVYQSSVAGTDYLSMCLESKDGEKSVAPDRSCWCLFRMTILNQKPGLNHMHRDSYGRLAADTKSGENTSLGWNDYMKMSDFLSLDSGYLGEDTACFSVSFHVIKESTSFSKNASLISGRSGTRRSDGHLGKFTWRIENFTRLKDLLKKRKITGLCIRSRRFQIGNRDCRLIVYPRGQSQPPCHLSVFLEVTDSRNSTGDWSCFVSHRLSVINQKTEEKSVTKESQNRYSKAAKDWGWREFVTLTSLFDQDAGFLVQDTVVFSAEVLILKETSIVQDFSRKEMESASPDSESDIIGKRSSFTWRVENFLSFKEIMETRKIFSKFFQAGGCELRIGVYESFDTICIYLESDQSSGSDLDKNFWVRYRMAVVNQKNPAKTVWKESSICTKTWNNSVLQFMKVSDLMEADAGFLVRDTVVFVCEVLDCCPWFEFSDLEVLASEDEQDAVSTDPDELVDSEESDGISGDEEDIFRNLLARAGFHLSYGDNPSQPQVTLREKLLMDAGAIAGFLTGLRVYLDDPAKVKRLLLPTKLSGNNNGRKEAMKNEANSPSLMNLLMGVKVLQQAIIDLLLDIMVECCQPSEDARISDDSVCTSNLKRTPDYTASGSGDGIRQTLVADSINQRLDSGVNENTNTNAVQSSDTNGAAGIFDAPVSMKSICYPVASASDHADDNSTRGSKTKWPEQSEELLGLIVNSLRALDNAVPQGCPEPRRRPQSAQKIALVLEKAPKHLQPDLVSLVPKLVDHSEHTLAARALLDRLQKNDTEPSLQLPVLGALSQLDFGSEVWEGVLFQACKLLRDSNDEPLAAAINFVFKAASQCGHLAQAVRAVRIRLKDLGSQVPSCVLDIISGIVQTRIDVAEMLLKDIDYDHESSGTHFSCCQSGSVGDHLHDPELELSGCNFSDIYVLIEMLLVPSLAVEASQVFERAIARGIFTDHSIAVVFEVRHSQRLRSSSNISDSSPSIDESIEDPIVIQEDDFMPVLSLVEALALSRDIQVQEVVKMLYVILFKMYIDENCRGRMLKGLVDRATSASSSCHEVELDLDILAFLVREEEWVVRPVLNMIREVAALANVDRAALWHQLCASEDETLRAREDKQAEISSSAKEKAALMQRINELEASNSALKSELKTEMERFNREKKELREQIQDADNQLSWLRSEREDDISKFCSERKSFQERLQEAESQLCLLKSRKRDEMKKVMKEKNALAERLKSAESARRRFDEELKRYATEKVTREEVRKSLEDEVQRLTQTVGQTEEEKREKEEQIARCEAYIDGMEAKLHACQQYIHNLEASLQEEMSRHAPLYGVGLEALSMKELETLARIHEDGLRQIHALQQRKGSGSSVLGPHSLSGHPQNHGLYSSLPPSVAVGLSPSVISNGIGIHGNGHINGNGMGPWFNPN